jgi:hypothetical protein
MRAGGYLMRAAAAASAVAVANLLAPPPALAHGLVGRQDLPIPEWLFAWAASLVLIASFVALTLAWREPRFEGDRWRAVSAGVSRALVNPVTEIAAGVIGVFLLGVVIWAGLNGTEAPDRNFAVTFVFVTFWVAVPFLSALLGDFFRAFNPWRAIGRVIGGAFQAVARQSAPAPLAYPERLGRWPAVAGIVGFGWFELVYGQPGFQAVGLTPRSVAIATLVYSAFTFAAMALFGARTWLARGEAFSQYFGMFARLSPLEVRDGRLGRRPWLTGAVNWATVPGSVALVLAAIGITAFDGASEGLLKGPIADTRDALIDAGLGPLAAQRTTTTLFMALTLGAIAGIYWAGVSGMASVRTAAGEIVATRKLGRLFAHTFIPIALAYLVAHYFSLVVFQEQAQFTYLLSDPLGDGSDLFGTAGGGIDYSLVGATLTWYVQVGALVIGHVLALVLGHDRALEVFGDARTAARSQYWMLALMVGFTSLGLFLLSQANA